MLKQLCLFGLIAASSSLASDAPASAARSPGSKYKNILIVGDNHTAQSYGIMLHGLFSSEGHKVATYGNCGSSPMGWFSKESWASTKCGYFQGNFDHTGDRGNNKKTPYFPDLLKDMTANDEEMVVPDLVIIGLGANQINMLESEASFKAQKATVTKMVASVKEMGAKCYWIGPPDGDVKKKPIAKQDRLYSMLMQAMNESENYCQFISSRQSAIPSMKYDCSTDGAHWDACTSGRIRAVHWANHVFSRVSENL